MLPIDGLRRHQEQRLLPALAAWEEAKKSLEKAIALAELREQEYREIADDVLRRLAALQLVISMTQELENAGVAELNSGLAHPWPMLAAQEHRVSNPVPATLQQKSTQPVLQLPSGLVRVSSRRLFPSKWRSNESSLSILQSTSHQPTSVQGK